MLKRSTVITLILLALAAGLYWYGQQPGNAIKKILAADSPDLSVTLISPDYAVNGFSIAAASGQSVSIQPQNNTWVVVANSRTGPANLEAAQAAIRSVQALRVQTKVDPSTDLAAFGLDKPAYVLTCFITSSEKTLTFKIGNPTVMKNGYYLLQDDGAIVIVSTNEIENLTNLLSEPPFLNTAAP